MNMQTSPGLRSNHSSADLLHCHPNDEFAHALSLNMLKTPKRCEQC